MKKKKYIIKSRNRKLSIKMSSKCESIRNWRKAISIFSTTTTAKV